MADVKISQLPSATTPLGGSEEIPLVQSSTTKKVTVGGLFTSPTLVTPDLGTPSAVNLTNATNVPMGQATGTLPIANGGTNATTAGTARSNLGAAASGANSDITSMSGITGSIGTADYVAFDTAYATPLAAGQLGWDGNNTLGLGMAGGNVVQHIGEDGFYYVKASSAITKGQVVMYTGAVGGSGVVTAAPATGVTNGEYILGIAAESISLNGFGLIQFQGTLRGLNTSAYVDGDILWYNPAVTGGLTKTKPNAPNVKVQVAAVINAGSGSSGSLSVQVHSGSTLGGTDSNVQFSALSNNDLIQYDSALQYWKNVSSISGSQITGNISGNAANVTGTVAIANGGTGQTTANAALNALLPSQGGNNGKVLTTNGTNTSWTTAATGTVTSVDVSGGTTGLTSSGGPVTTSGTITLAGTLNVTNGGTGATTLTGYVKGNGTSAMTASSTVPGSDVSGNISGNAANVTGTVAVGNGGTGATTLTGYVKGNGTSAMTASSTIPGSDVSGNISGNAANVTGTVAVTNGGTGQTTYTDGQLLIGNSATGGLTKATLTAGTNVSIVNGNGTITIAATGGSGGGDVSGPASATNNAVALFDGTTGKLIKDSAQTIASTNTASTVVARDASGNFSAGTITATLSGNATNVTGTVAVANGGTGLTSGTSGGVPYYSAANTIASSAALAANALVIGGGAGVAPSTITTGTGVVTALGVNTGSAGAFVVNGGALGTPSSGTVTNLTGTASININGTVGATTPTTGNFTAVTSTSEVVTGASGVLTRAAATQDGVALVGRAGGTSSYSVTLTPTTLSASRTLTLPDNSGTVLTSGATVTIAQGGTNGTATPTAGAIAYGTGTAYAFSSAGTSGQALLSGGSGVPTFGTLGTAAGGTGLTSFTANGAVYATSTSALTTGTLPVASGGTGTSTAFTAGSVVFAGASGVYSQSNANFFWDNTNARLGIGTASPAYKLDVVDSATNAISILRVKTTGTGGQALLDLDSTASGAAAYLRFLGAGVENARISADSTSINFNTGSGATERMRIDSNGNLLVGTTTNNGRISSVASGAGTAGYFASSGSTISVIVADGGANGANIAMYGNGATTPNKYIRAQSGGFEIVNSGYSATIMRVADAGVYSTAVGATNRVMYVDNTNLIGYLSSVRASKTNIAPMPATDWLLQLQPKTFNYRKKDADGKYTDEADGGIQYGLIAEEVEQVKPDLCFYDEVDGKQELRGIHYEKLVVPMLKAIQELKAEVDSLKAQLAAKG